MNKLHTQAQLPCKNRLFSLPIILSAISVAMAPLTQANEQEWWFDVEVIIFERELTAKTTTENFTQADFSRSNQDLVDLLSSYMHPDLSFLQAGLSYCSAAKRAEQQQQNEQDFAITVDAATQKMLDETTPSFLIDANQTMAVGDEWHDQQSNKNQLPLSNLTELVSENTILGDDNSEPLSSSTDTPILSDDAMMVRPPIHVNWVEWQIPSSLPCAYSDQLDPKLSLPSEVESANELAPERVARTPIKIDGIEWQRKRGPFFIPQTAMFMHDLYDGISRQADISPILHMSWRQQVTFGRENAKEFRVFAGKNYAHDFDSNGIRKTPDTYILFNHLTGNEATPYIPAQELEEQTTIQDLLESSEKNTTNAHQQFMRKIDQALADENPVMFKPRLVDKANYSDQAVNNNRVTSDIWQLDGKVAVYLRNVGRVPYLHIDSNLDYRNPIFVQKLDTTDVQKMDSNLVDQQPIPSAIITNQKPEANFLQNANFNQLRRIISKQVHYFDHPLFGMIVRLNRYEWPEVEENEPPQEQTNAVPQS